MGNSTATTTTRVTGKPKTIVTNWEAVGIVDATNILRSEYCITDRQIAREILGEIYTEERAARQGEYLDIIERHLFGEIYRPPVKIT